ncbi:MAG: hypothetical protein E7415_03945 [Ruminococcaceae bacterium]|nr:hypothetical protein [Oscillospiraceae bacterium]
MLYKKNTEKVLSGELFKNPTSEYRGAPFWSWNCKMTKEMLTEQIEILKEMGFGGFHMHSRTGMDHEYLGDEFMDLVSACVEKAKEEGMYAWLYDEDRYPSGFAGGHVTKHKKYRVRPLIFTKEKQENVDFDKEASVENDSYYFVGAYAVSLNAEGELTSYKKIGFDDEADNKWYAYLRADRPDPWFNDYCYVDAMNGDAVDEFIKVTHERYKEKFGDDFGETIPAIFTDEPNCGRMWAKQFAHGDERGVMLWTLDFDETYKAEYGFDIVDKIPELFWNLENNVMSRARYCYHCHVNKRFSEAFTDKVGKWCEENNIYLTGHVLDEENMFRMTTCIGETMTLYRGFGLPGIDVLCDRIELSTAKQCQSVVHQYGKEGMLSELNGVMGWEYDFRDYKFHGDWQTALGVTVRVPHLSWVSMEGRAKRDYPASFNYQSPWYKEHKYLEDHYARLNTVLTRGKPIVKVGVIHPIESYWANFGPNDTTGFAREDMDDNFAKLCEYLLFGTVDFDFISEAMLPDLCGEIGKSLQVGQMEYDSIVVSGCQTLRKSTVEILKKFAEKGGKVVFVGDVPKYVDAIPSDEVKKVSEKSVNIPFSKIALVEALKDEKMVWLNDEDGETSRKFIYNMRQDGDYKWLFIAHAEKGDEHRICTHNTCKTCQDVSNPQLVKIRVKGNFKPIVFDTISGETYEIDYKIVNGCTVFENVFYLNNSLLVRLEETENMSENGKTEALGELLEKMYVPKTVVTREEMNVVLLDECEFKLDDGEFEPEEEIMRIDNICRDRLSIPKRTETTVQPWVMKEEEVKHSLTMRFKLESAIDYEGAYLAIEHPEEAEIWFNDEKINPQVEGYFTDKSIKTIKLPIIKKGENVLIVKIPFAERKNPEWMYILGEFDVKLIGKYKKIVPIDNEKGFGSVTGQGMPFYGGSLIYESEFETKNDGAAYIKCEGFRGPVIRAFVDNEDAGVIAIQPYTVKVNSLKAGKHKLKLILYGNRHNSFGSLHHTNFDDYWNGAIQWHTPDGMWSYEHNLKEFGILHAPMIEVRK